MRRKRQKLGKSSNNLKLASLFIFLVLGIISLSILLRIFLLFGNSKFDGSNSFIVIASEENGRQAINFSPKTNSISIVTFQGVSPKDLDVPKEGDFKSSEIINSENLASLLMRKIINSQSDMNFMDFLRLFLFTNTVKKDNFLEKSINKETAPAEVSEIIQGAFQDPEVQKEKLNIEVVNGTDIPGLGNRVGNMVSNVGGNVILVRTGDLEDKSRIEYINSSYTLKKLQRILGFSETHVMKSGVPDVRIIIGKDNISNFKF